MPLFAGGALQGSIRAASARLRAARAEVVDQERQLDTARVSADARWRAARAELDARREADDAAAEAFELVDERYRNGLAGVTAWLDARRARDRARVDLANAAAELGSALAEVEAAHGVAATPRR